MSETNEITINGETYLKKSSLSAETVLTNRCVIRCRNAGVHVGEIVDRNELVLKVKNSNRIWKWSGAFTLSEVAMNGVDRSNSRIAALLPAMDLTTNDVCEVIPIAEGVDLSETKK